MKSVKELLLFLLEQVNILGAYCSNRTEIDFLTDELLQDGCLMKLLVIGKYSSKLSDGFKTRFNDIEWQVLNAARNYYAHAYGNIKWMKV